MSSTTTRPHWLPRRALAEWAGISVLFAALALALGAQSGLGRADLVLYDVAQALRPHAAAKDIVIVAIDDASIAALGRWPWRRAMLAAVFERIVAGQPRAIGLDLILSEPDARDPKGDAALAQALASARGLVLPVTVQTQGSGPPQLLQPAAMFRPPRATLAHALVEPDADGAVRSLFLAEGDARGFWPAFSLAMSGATLQSKDLPGERRPAGPVAADAWLRDYRVHVGFAGPPGTIARVPAVKLLTDEQSVASLAGKYVFVGATATGLGDAYPTPFTGHAELMPGVEVQAQALDALMQGRTAVLADARANALFTLLPVALALAAFVWLRPQFLLIATAALAGAVLLASYALLALAQVWFPPAAALLLLAIAYPFWSWRRLNAVMRFLGSQFEQLEREPAVVPRPAAKAARRFSDVLGRQLAAMRDAADRLREARRFVADSLDGLPIAALVADADERVLIANQAAAQLFGATDPTTLRGLGLEELFARTAADSELPWQELQREMQTANRGKREFRDMDGRSLELHAALATDPQGQRSGILITLVDLSAIRTAQRKRDDALAFLSHDIRSPQASILAAAELHELDPHNYPAESALQKIQGYARNTIELAEQFVQLSRVETQAYALADCDLGEIAREAAEAVRVQAAAKSIGIDCACDAPAWVRVDRALILRAIVNLANNAVKYSPKSTSVTIAVVATQQGVRCSVRDQGYGISEKDQQRLFQRFARFSTAGQPQEKGLGLGLAFVHTVIERHRGTMQVSSAPGAGSEFGFILPHADTHASPRNA